MEKRGAAHFEMIIAFTFFIAFVFFLFMVLQPQISTSLFDPVVVGIQDNFEKAVSVNLGSIFLMANYSGPKSCFYFDFPSDTFVLNFSDASSLVMDLDGKEVNSSFGGGRLSINKGEEFFRVQISSEFSNEVLSGCKVVDPYGLGSVIEREVVSYSKLVGVRDRYFDDYEMLKRELKVPGIFDFAIVPYDLSEIYMLPVDGIPEGVSVLAQDKVFEVLKEDGNLSNERISFRVW
ncbi:hypothetical protein KAT36_04580 [Candidatus Pacearchaeota archaeon]|nr:hypothetical protein [Candidatus Pacearchaeota archaeon]